MQVFLPYPDLKRSVCCLDPKRLGNQVYRECLTLIRGGWPNHPASKMWRGFEPWIFQYAMHGLDELCRRGFSDFKKRNIACKFIDALNNLNLSNPAEWCLHCDEEHLFTVSGPLPPWFGDDHFHSSHRAALLFKNPEWYGRFGWSEKPAVPDARGRLPYFWPV